jgi:LPXTG-motif cell wall-anchored protein
MKKTKLKEATPEEGSIMPVMIAVGLAAIAVGAFFIFRRK